MLPDGTTARSIGRYRVDAKLGEGGMGAVYQVWDPIAGRALALKCLTSAAAQQPTSVALFEHEFHTLKNLEHPHIVAAFDYGITEAPYYTMELLTGTTALQLSPMPWQRACSLLRDVASALALVHSRRLVHRDITTRNIQCTENGTVKLIDFGSLVPMGVARECVGTPAFTAPEVLNQLALDQRTDLYSLGATAYYLLTGGHAFPVRRFSELRDSWRSRPRPPSSITAGIPSELDALVLSMLNLDAMARPLNAGIVIARLTAIAGLPHTSQEAGRSFLVTPRLVGRRPEVNDFQRRVARAMRGEGSCLLVEAEPGLGRSRILEAFALEAQIAGALVLRADGRDGATEADTLAALRRGLRAALPDEAAPDADERGATLSRLSEVAQAKCIVIVVDDAHQYSAASLALLTRLSRLTEDRRLVLVVSHALPLPDDVVGALRLLRGRADRSELHALDLSQTHELLASCFDNAPHTRAVAAWCHTVSAGRPATCMALAQHLVDTGIAAYEGGAWALPESLSGHSLPETVEQLLDERLRRLDDDQRLWGQVLSLIPAAAALSTADCVEFMLPYTSRARAHAAIDALAAEQLVVLEGAVTRVSQSSVRDAFLATLPDELARALHTRLAGFFESRGDNIGLSAAAHHLQLAGDQREAIRIVNRYAKQVLREKTEEEMARFALPFGQWGDTFESALDFAEREGWPQRELYPLYTAVMSAAALSNPRWLSRAEPLFEYLRRDTGLIYWSDAELTELERGAKVSAWKLVGRLLRALFRHMFGPRKQRGLHPFAALTLLGVYVTTALGVRNITQTFHLGVPPLARALLPFRALSPALALLYDMLTGAADAGRGLAAGWRRLQSVIERAQRRVRGMPDIYRRTAHHVLRYLHAVECLAPIGDPRALEVAEWLEQAGDFNAHAWQLRMLYYLYVGDGMSAERCRQELETLALTTARYNLSVTSGLKDVAQAQALGGDAPALRATLESLEATAERFPHWQGQLLVYRGEYARLVGDLALARDTLEQALEFAKAGENYTWAKAVAPYTEVLLRLGHIEQAVEVAERSLAETARLDIAPIYRRQIEIAAALAWATQGQRKRAAQRLEELLAEAVEQGVCGIAIAVLHEARARVALLAADGETFKHACQGVARVFADHNNPALAARYRRLVDEATGRGLEGFGGSPARTFLASTAEIRERIDDAPRDKRLLAALELLITHCDADGGHLFVVRETNVGCVASAGEVVSSLDVENYVESLLLMDEDNNGGVTATKLGDDDEEEADLSRWTSTAGVIYHPVLLHSWDRPDDAALGVAILHPAKATLRRPEPEFLRAFVHVLTEMDALSVTVRDGKPLGV